MLRNKIQRSYFTYLGCVIALLLATAVSGNAQDVTRANALSALLSGNERFVAGKLQAKDYLTERAKLAQGQHPYAIVLACADSRVAPEIIFDESLGKLFVVRTAGHVVDPVALGSIEYAVEHLHVNLLLVLGHESCGAVKATISGGEASSNIKALLNRIKPAVDKVLAEGVAESELLSAAVKENVRYQMQKSIFESEVLADFVYQKKLAIAGGVYHLQTGNVELVVTDLAVERAGPKKDTEKKETEAHSASEIRTDRHEAHGTPSDSKVLAEVSGSNEKEPHTQAAKPPSFEKSVRLAYEKKLDVMMKKTMLMRDEHDRCATDDCRKISPGETVKLDSPLVLTVMGRRQLRVRYKGKPYFILADADALEVVEN